MGQSEALKKISIHEHAGQLSEPFTMVDLVEIDDQVLSLYLCQGTMPLHRHVDQDELFLVHSGTMSLESEWGTSVLRPGELTVAPKGVGHKSSSLLRSMILLFQPRLVINRRNGDRRLFAVKGQGKLEKVSVEAMGRQIVTPFQAVILASVDVRDLTLTLCEGSGPWQKEDKQDSLVFCYDGHLALESDKGLVNLRRGELVLVPKGVKYRLTSMERSLVIGLERHEQPGLPLAE